MREDRCWSFRLRSPGRELGFLAPAEGKNLTDLAAEVGRLLNGLVNRFQDESGRQVFGLRP